VPDRRIGFGTDLADETFVDEGRSDFLGRCGV
jgi:hypothetical protein